MKSWQPISNGGKFYVQLTGARTLHEDSRGRPIHYRSIEGARKAADELNRAMSQAAAILSAAILSRRAHSAKRAIDRIDGDTTDNRLENLRAVRAAEPGPAAAERRPTV